MSLGIADLLKKYKETQAKVALTTRCHTFKGETGTIKDVFNDFFLFITVDDRYSDVVLSRHWIPIENIAVITEEPKVKTDGDVEIVR